MQIGWDSIIKEYSQRELTFGKDRLPALAGLAARYGKETGYTYLAGLWREEMPQALLWYRSTVLLPYQQHPASETAPSWSWACANGPIEIRQEHEVERFSAKASIAAFHCRTSRSDPFSVVEEAWIDVKGRLSVVTEQIDTGAHFVTAGNQSWWSFPDDRKRLPKPYPDDAIANGHVYLLMIGVSPITEGINEHYALVLQWSGIRNGHQCFLRLGMASCGRKDSEPPDLSDSWESKLIRLI